MIQIEMIQDKISAHIQQCGTKPNVLLVDRYTHSDIQELSEFDRHGSTDTILGLVVAVVNDEDIVVRVGRV